MDKEFAVNHQASVSVTGTSRLRGGFSIIEVSLALVVLVGGLMLTVGQFANVSSLQKQTESSTGIDRLAQSLIDRINSVTFSHLGTERAPWTIARYERLDDTNTWHLPLGSTSAIGRNPMTLNVADATAKPYDDLLELGLTRGLRGADDLRVYLEYWRAVDFTDAAGVLHPGLMQTPSLSTDDFRTRVYVDPTNRALGIKSEYRFANLVSGDALWDPKDISEGNSPALKTSLIDPTHPVLIRIILVWDDEDPDPTRYRPRQRRELFTARTP